MAIVDSSGFLVGAVVLVTVSGFASVWLRSVWPLLFGFVLALAYYFWRLHMAGLVPVTEQEHRVAKRSAWAAFVALFLPSWFS